LAFDTIIIFCFYLFSSSWPASKEQNRDSRAHVFILEILDTQCKREEGETCNNSNVLLKSIGQAATAASIDCIKKLIKFFDSSSFLACEVFNLRKVLLLMAFFVKRRHVQDIESP